MNLAATAVVYFFLYESARLPLEYVDEVSYALPTSPPSPPPFADPETKRLGFVLELFNKLTFRRCTTTPAANPGTHAAGVRPALQSGMLSSSRLRKTRAPPLLTPNDREFRNLMALQLVLREAAAALP